MMKTQKSEEEQVSVAETEEVDVVSDPYVS